MGVHNTTRIHSLQVTKTTIVTISISVNLGLFWLNVTECVSQLTLFQYIKTTLTASTETPLVGGHMQ